MNELTNEKNHQNFEQIKQVDEYGNEFWYARALAKILDYADFRNFTKVIHKAISACEASGNKASDHIVEVNEMVKIGSSAERIMDSFSLSRYACYLIVQNGDPSKPVIAAGQTYFAIQTRRKELEEDAGFQELSEEKKRLMLRNELAEHNKHLAAAAKDAGVESGLDYAIFQNHGYKGLYGGLDNKAIHARKQLKRSHKILDHMGSTELAANLFRATQTEEKLKRDEVKSKSLANQTHNDVGVKIRETIKELGGTMPEDLATPEESIKTLASKQQKNLEKKERSHE